MTEHFDYFGNRLSIGDIVVYQSPYYREFLQGEVDRFTNKFVFLKLDTYPYSIKQEGKQLIKIK